MLLFYEDDSTHNVHSSHGGTAQITVPDSSSRLSERSKMLITQGFKPVTLDLSDVQLVYLSLRYR